MFPDHSLTTNSHRTLMVVGGLAALGLVFALFLGWYEFFQERTRREMLIKMAEATTERSSLMAAQKAFEPEPAKPVATLQAIGKDEPSNDNAPMVRLADPVSQPQLAAASAVLQKFWQAADWMGKVACVHDAERVKPLLQAYYETQRNKDPISAALVHSDRYKLNGRDLLVLSYASSLPGGEVNAILLAEPDGSYRLDWESYVGWGDLSFPDYKKQRPAARKLLRVHARIDDAYKGEFSDPASYLVVELVSPDGLYTLHGFCDKGSLVAKALSTILDSGAQAKLALTLQYPPEGKTAESVRITALTADRWLLLK